MTSKMLTWQYFSPFALNGEVVAAAARANDSSTDSSTDTSDVH